LSKRVIFVPTTSTVDAVQYAGLFFNNVFRHFGLPKALISDRDPCFTSHFSSALFKRLGTNLKLSTAHHPQTDGQTECANRTIEDMLRAYVAPHHNNWDEVLVAAEFACNNSIQASTGFIPF
jgi:transposase InsO family protein